MFNFHPSVAGGTERAFVLLYENRFESLCWKLMEIHGIKQVFWHQFKHFYCLTWKNENWSTLTNYQTEWLTIRADWHQHGHEQFVALFHVYSFHSNENLLSKLPVKAILTYNHWFPFPCCCECLTFTRLLQKGLNAPLFYFIKIVLSICAQYLTASLKLY